MFQQYKRTLPFVQLTIFAVTIWIYATANHLLVPAAVFFVAMQLSAIFGAMWAYRLKTKLGGVALPTLPVDNKTR